MITLKEGDKAPAFSARDQNGKKVSLSELKGKKVVLYFYPEDDTPTCTIQACNLRDNYTLLRRMALKCWVLAPMMKKAIKSLKRSLVYLLLYWPTPIMLL
jgi:peroxiredoxin Q/BCP